MFKNIVNDLKLNKISYLLEVIEKGNFKEKVDAYNKLKKIKINEEAGHLIIDKVMSLKHNNKDNFDIDISLLSLLFTKYYDSYSEHLFIAFKDLHIDAKHELLNILSNSNEPSEIILYRTLLFNYYKELDYYPIGNISSNEDNYELLFPELYEVFKSKNNKNNILLLLNDFINKGVVPLYHLDKNKKILQKVIVNIFKEGIKYKIDPKENFMSDKDYLDLRVFLETAINIEYFVSNKETKSNLDKLFKTKDNQLKLFILENYVRKGKDISKLSLTSIAKDNLSRYPLYSFLKYSNLEKLMPRKYKNNKDLSLSDLYLNYSISTGYLVVPYDFELLEERIINDYKYYIFKFKTKFNYNEEIVDPVTDYLLKNIKIDDVLSENGETTYLGISGGFSINDPSLIEKPINGTKVTKYTEDYEDFINKLVKEEIVVTEPEQKEEPKEVINKEPEVKEEPKENIFTKLGKIFSFSRILTFFSVSFILLFAILILYVSNIDLFNLRKHTLNKSNIINAVLLKPKDLFGEINYNEIFTREEPEYYVLFFKKKDKSTYYEYLNTVLKNNYKFYYVDISKKDNKPIFEGNETGFVISEDTLLKVSNHDYSFYVIGKKNILNELKSYVDEIKKNEEKELKEERKEKKERESINVDDMLKELEELENNKETPEENPES